MIAREDRVTPRAQAAPGTGIADRGYLWRQRLIRALIHAGLILWAILCVYPMLFTVLSALKLSPELYANPFALPTRWVWGNFRDAWSFGHMGQYFFNSVVVTAVSTVLVLFLGSTCGFALARFDFPLKPVVWSYILFGF